MQELFQQIQTYLNMDEEIDFKEFDQYYKRVLATFNESGEQFSEQEVWYGLFISENLLSNADDRRKESKGSQAKKYKKINERMSLWAKNFASRLVALGYTEEQMNERFEAMFEEKAEQ
ncbi:hypothetical protein [Texcoconibacillus texcoconensis]|uniref:Uncharacterized protein n=1 Tax=Texcoconibacillus texcoconensis TaxID=1095777 RepID=A0A840QNV7_9BACI|nr:hypothetical protein [Texcoconibacillus texcoconensis]MBB5173038.1 hypothetical protein [Texcoconibacillus texcoconensis]